MLNQIKNFIINFFKRNNLKLFIGYMICGTIATLVDLGFLYIFTEFFKIWYFYSSFFSYLLGLITSYNLNKHLLFKNKSKQVVKQFSMFTIILLVGLVLNQTILYTLVEVFDLWYVLAKIITAGIVVFWHFFANKNLTFKIFT